MGYEVLDVGHARSGEADAPRAPAGRMHVVDLESLPQPRPDAERRSAGRRRPTRWTAAALTAATLVAGIGVGVWIDHRSKVREQTAAAAQVRVLAVAQPATMTLAGRITAASVRISLVNLGQAPVDVLVSPPVARPFAGATVVGMANGSARIDPGGSQQVVALVGIICGTQTPVTPQISVRGPDGQTHQLTVRDENLDTYRVNRRAVCGDPDGALLTSQLVGTVRNPQLVLRNATHHAVAIIVDADSPVRLRPPVTGPLPQSARVGAVGPPTTVTTFPSLPVILSAEDDITLSLRVQVRGCQALDSLNEQSYLLLVGVPIAVEHTVPQDVTTAVDLTALMGSAQERACG
ncbi:hypothetical protein ACPPVT_01790 [Angustibacter sp. McL0619]|uniref:hypothetical protein n=1 Tax=Angustibacter sp. McL0619 TaxID=3415676 RepID=UPI003CF7C558